MLLPPTEHLNRPPVAGPETGPEKPLSLPREASVFRRMAGWVRSGMEVLEQVDPATVNATLALASLVREGDTLHQAANAGAKGKPLSLDGGVGSLGQRIRSWLSRVRSWVQKHLPPPRHDKYLQALDDLRTEMRTEMAKLETRMAKLEVGQARLEASQVRLETSQAKLETSQAKLETSQTKLEDQTQRLWGETTDHRGIRYEKGAARAISSWLRDYARHRGWNLELKLLWSDRVGSIDFFSWDSVQDEHNLPDSKAVQLSDFLIQAVWSRKDGPADSIEMLLVGEVSTEMNEYRQTKVSDAYFALTQQPGRPYTVLPMQFGVHFSEQNEVAIPHLVRMQVTEDDLRNRGSINHALVSPPDMLHPSLDELLARGLELG